MTQKVTILCADDWCGLYIDGKLFDQDHQIHAEMLLEALGIEHEFVDCSDEYERNRANSDGYPDTLVDCRTVGLIS